VTAGDDTHHAVEILSTDPARDIIRRAAEYAAAGLERYWIIDPAGTEVVSPAEALSSIKPGKVEASGQLCPDLARSDIYQDPPWACSGAPDNRSRLLVGAQQRSSTTVSLEIAPDVAVSLDPAIFLA